MHKASRAIIKHMLKELSPQGQQSVSCAQMATVWQFRSVERARTVTGRDGEENLFLLSLTRPSPLI